MPAQGRQSHGVGGVVGEVETALQRQRVIAGVGQAGAGRPEETGDLLRVPGLGFKLTGPDQVIQVG